MSHRHAKWFRDAEASKPIYRLTCNRCGKVMLTTDPELSKVAHQTDHFGQPWDFGLRKDEQAATDAEASDAKA